MSKHWSILTGEYPPQPGGVSDYTGQVAEGLMTAGDEVHVWAPDKEGVAGSQLGTLVVHRVKGGFGLRGLAGLRSAMRAAGDNGRGPLLVQYSPHAFGMKGLNLPLCRWIARQSRRRPVWVMFHEVAYYNVPGQPWRHRLLALVNRLMAGTLARAAERVFVTIPAWEDLLREIVPNLRPVTWLPVASNVPMNVNTTAVAAVRAQFIGEGAKVLIGHFGTFGTLITTLLDPIVAELLRAPSDDCRVLLIGRGSALHCKALTRAHAGLVNHIYAADGLGLSEVAEHMAACDVLVQPFPDGVSCRRTTVMAGLALGVPVVTNVGDLSEPFWTSSDALSAVSGTSPAVFARAVQELLADKLPRTALGNRGLQLYRDRFAIERTVDALRAMAVGS